MLKIEKNWKTALFGNMTQPRMPDFGLKSIAKHAYAD